ncbi:MAG: Gfo/Idh/MocA family oxidoreductase [Thermoguttaceae bacterium]
MIGLSGRGGSLLGALLGNPEAQVLAVCDVFKSRTAAARERVIGTYRGRNWAGAGAVQGYRDFRELLARDDIDAVVIATVPHWHALIAVHACKAGKDVYSEKPLSMSVADNYAILQAVRRYGRVFQHGTQWGTTTDPRRHFALIRSGRLGQVRYMETGSRGIPPATEVSLPAEPVPDDLDWDLWLGPCPWRPYNGKFVHYGWAWCPDFTAGWLDEWGSHVFDLFLWYMDMERASPTEILPPDKDDPRLKIVFPNGLRILHDPYMRQKTCQYRIHGTEGVLQLYHTEVPEHLRNVKIDVDQLPGHSPADLGWDWLQAIRTRRDPWRNIEVAYHSATVVRLAAIGLELDRPLKWDGQKRQFIGDDEANRLLTLPKRAPWGV